MVKQITAAILCILMGIGIAGCAPQSEPGTNDAGAGLCRDKHCDSLGNARACRHPYAGACSNFDARTHTRTDARTHAGKTAFRNRDWNRSGAPGKRVIWEKEASAPGDGR